MHVTARRVALCGLLLAFSVICMVLGSVFETNTLFLLAAASYFVGIVIREFGLRTGAAFYLASVLPGFLTAPNKFYVISFSAMGLYILGTEALFNLMFLPVTAGFWHLLFAASPSPLLWAAVILAGQAGLWLYDRAYLYAQRHLWGRFRKYFM